MTGKATSGPLSGFMQAWRFGLTSLAGLGLDTAVFLALVAMGMRAFHANAVGATLAVTFVFFASVRRIFMDRSRFLTGKFVSYLAYQLVAVTAASFIIDLMVGRGQLAPLLAKILVLPLTFGANFAFMRWLTRPGSPR